MQRGRGGSSRLRVPSVSARVTSVIFRRDESSREFSRAPRVLPEHPYSGFAESRGFSKTNINRIKTLHRNDRRTGELVYRPPTFRSFVHTFATVRIDCRTIIIARFVRKHLRTRSRKFHGTNYPGTNLE